MGFFNTLDKDIYAKTKERTGVRWTGSLANFKDLHGPLLFSGPQFPCMKMRRGSIRPIVFQALDNNTVLQSPNVLRD